MYVIISGFRAGPAGNVYTLTSLVGVTQTKAIDTNVDHSGGVALLCSIHVGTQMHTRQACI